MPSLMVMFILVSFYLEGFSLYALALAEDLVSMSDKASSSSKDNDRVGSSWKRRGMINSKMSPSIILSTKSKGSPSSLSSSMDLISLLLDSVSVFEGGFGWVCVLEMSIDLFLGTVGIFLFSSIFNSISKYNQDDPVDLFYKCNIIPTRTLCLR